MTHSALVLIKGRIQLPVQVVLDRPVSTYRLGKTLGSHKLAEDVVANSDLLFAVRLTVDRRHADRREALPSIAVGKIRRRLPKMIDSQR